MTLEDAVEESIRVSVSHKYYPRDFERMWRASPTIETLERLVTSSELQSGFRELAKLGLLRYSAEQLVLNYSSNREAKDAARFRLENWRLLR